MGQRHRKNNINKRQKAERMKTQQKKPAQKRNDGEKVTLTNGLASLSADISKLKLAIPRLQKAAGLENPEDRVAAILEAAAEIETDVPTAVESLLKIDRQIAEARAEGNDRKIQALEQVSAEQTAVCEAYLSEILHQDGLLGKVAGIAYIKTALTVSYQNPDEMMRGIYKLVDRGLLVAGMKVKLGYNKYYDLPKSLGLNAKEAQEVISTIEQAQKVYVGMESQRREAAKKRMENEASITVDELVAGKEGRCVAYLPAEKRKGYKHEWRGGGHITFETAKGRGIKLVEAAGSVYKIVNDIAALGIVILYEFLNWGREATREAKEFKLVGNEFKVVRTYEKKYLVEVPKLYAIINLVVARKLATEENAEEYADKLLTAWHMLDKARRHLEENRANEQVRVDMEKQAEITVSEYFGLNGANGIPVEGKVAFLQFERNREAVRPGVV